MEGFLNWGRGTLSSSGVEGPRDTGYQRSVDGVGGSTPCGAVSIGRSRFCLHLVGIVEAWRDP